jgi:small subunit ribosomal protein S29
MPKQTKAAAKSSVKGAKSFAMKKKIPVKTGKPPMPGERKAMRKRIVLSNTNALQVEGLHDLSKDMEMAVHTGKVVGLPGEVVDSLRAVEAFKVTQGWGMFRRPALLIREESVAVTENMKYAEQQKGGFRLVIDGERGTGKSLMLLHAMATAFVRGWIVLNIPEGIYTLSPLSLCIERLLTNFSPRSHQRSHRILTHSKHISDTLLSEYIRRELALPNRQSQQQSPPIPRIDSKTQTSNPSPR